MEYLLHLFLLVFRDEEALFKNRNYDPQSRAPKKRERGQKEENTVEQNVEGLAKMIIAEDEEQRAQDLVKKCLGRVLDN